jgi:hypothetical protein
MDIGAASEQHHSSINFNEQSFATYSGSRPSMRGFVVLMFMFTLSRARSHKSRPTAFNCPGPREAWLSGSVWVVG